MGALWLDFLIFGNGYGMAAPYFDQRLYWLVDTSRGGRKAGRGTFYLFDGWFGAQLTNWQWTHPKAGERRRLVGREFVVFHSRRRWLRVEVSWALVGLPKDINEANAVLERLAQEVGR